MAETVPRIPPDDITAFCGHLPADEYEARRQIRTSRNSATFRLNTITAPDARTLLWICADTAAVWLYDCNAKKPELARIAAYCMSLLALAEQAEAIANGYE